MPTKSHGREQQLSPPHALRSGQLSRSFSACGWVFFTGDDEIIRVGASYLQIVGLTYGFYGLGMALYFATQGFGSVIWTVIANALRLLVSAGRTLIVIYWLDFGPIGFFGGIAAAFCLYAALTTAAIFRVKQPAIPK